MPSCVDVMLGSRVGICLTLTSILACVFALLQAIVLFISDNIAYTGWAKKLDRF